MPGGRPKDDRYVYKIRFRRPALRDSMTVFKATEEAALRYADKKREEGTLEFFGMYALVSSERVEQ